MVHILVKFAIVPDSHCADMHIHILYVLTKLNGFHFESTLWKL